MVISIYKYLLMYMSTARSAGTGRKFAGKPRDHGALKEFRMIAKLLLQNTFFVVGMGVVLFATAGTLHWPAAWVYLATSAILGPACGLWLARTDPGLLAERMRLTARDEQPAADKKFMLVFVVVALFWFVAMGLDRRMHASDVPLALQVLGLANVPTLDRLRHVGVPRKLLCRPRRQGAGRAPPSRDLDRSLCVRAPSHVQRHHAGFSSARRCCWDPGGVSQ